VHPGPPPAHAIQIWIGAYKPRMLGLVGRLADGWVASAPYAPPEAISAMRDGIDRAAEKAGRDPGEIRRIYNFVGWVDTEQVSSFLELGFDTLIFWPQGDVVEEIERFAAEIMSQV
jgi:alkanesulfonate monooxygenase SsuD/methylene tetrahydromethanopterin reductase-like flavin-dependent oxidoreductase (luciferase family)